MTTVICPPVSAIVLSNLQEEFTNDVQLGWYPSDPRNCELAGNYIFTSNAIDGYKSSIDLLKKARDGFLYEGNPNRLVVIATYGHGKSHFALALANFFGKSYGSPEVGAILRNIEHASDGPSVTMFRNFKEGRQPYLVLRLRGDQPQGLTQQVMSGIEEALREVPGVEGLMPPFWYADAERFLDGLSSEQKQKIDAALQEYGTDVASLTRRVREKDPTTYDLCRKASSAVFGVPLDFGGETSLQSVIEWVADEVCGEEKPTAGLLILFDEFSAFIQRYAERGGGGSLQDLLNGVSNRRSKVVFVAFGQHDPDTAADNAYRALNDAEGLNNLKKELNRLPKDDQHRLFSSLETVLDVYLKQDVGAWLQLMGTFPTAIGEVTQATDATMQLFPERYDYAKGWGTERVQECLTRGCFPLHPLTIALFCSVRLREITSHRSVLGFVTSSLNRKMNEPALQDGETELDLRDRSCRLVRGHAGRRTGIRPVYIRVSAGWPRIIE